MLQDTLRAMRDSGMQLLRLCDQLYSPCRLYVRVDLLQTPYIHVHWRQRSCAHIEWLRRLRIPADLLQRSCVHVDWLQRFCIYTDWYCFRDEAVVRGHWGYLGWECSLWIMPIHNAGRAIMSV